MKTSARVALALGLIAGLSITLVSRSQVEPVGLAALSATSTPLPNLAGVVTDAEAAKQLGKALFWDINLGKDGTACASCHHAAGADTRIENAMSPGQLDLRWTDGDRAFGGLTTNALSGMTASAASVFGAWPGDFSPAGTEGKTASGATAGPGLALRAQDFPTHQLRDVGDRNSAILYTTNDAISSQGVTAGTGAGLPVDGTGEVCTPDLDSPFLMVDRNGQTLLRSVPPRNAQSTINAGFHKRNFWDGRANNVFNGVDPFGNRSPNALVLAYNARNNSVSAERLALTDANLASQAVGPPLSQVEMSCGGRTFPMLGRKMLALPILQSQEVHPGDSLLGGLADNRPTYLELVEQAFDPRWWSAPATARYTRSATGIVPENNGFTQAELNFSMFMGIAIMLYESTLVSGETPLDRSLGGVGPRGLSRDERAGMDLFVGKGQCIACHTGPVLTNGTQALVEYMPMADGGAAFYDGSFYNLGVNSTVTDLGLGEKDPWGTPLSYTRQLLTGQVFDDFTANFCQTDLIPFPFRRRCDPADQLAQAQAAAASQRVAVDGAFQTPTLRNIGLTPPYFHNGSAKSLAEVVQFYNRGGNARGPLGSDTTGTGPLGRPLGLEDPVAAYRRGSNLGADLGNLGLTGREQRQLVAFMLAMTDERVRCDQAPFDHPSLPIPTGDAAGTQLLLPAVGATGLAASGAACRPNSGELFTEFAHLSRMR
ncbi:MAG: cytochrome-c peroxidase [Steroidobacteraceae bacterium]